MSYDAQFEKAVEIVKNLPPTGKVQPSQEQKLDFYANFKQGNEGDVNTSRPGMMDFVGKAKWDAWKKLEGTSKEDAKRAYIEHLRLMLKKSADAGDEDAKKYLADLEGAGPSA